MSDTQPPKDDPAANPTSSNPEAAADDALADDDALDDAVAAREAREEAHRLKSMPYERFNKGED